MTDFVNSVVNLSVEEYDGLARVKAFSVDGAEMWIPSGDHRPPHFHARATGGEWQFKVDFLEAEDAMIHSIKPRGARIPAAIRRAVTDGAARHRAELLEEWIACGGEDTAD